jgi:hypothetical protein
VQLADQADQFFVLIVDLTNLDAVFFIPRKQCHIASLLLIWFVRATQPEFLTESGCWSATFGLRAVTQWLSLWKKIGSAKIFLKQDLKNLAERS